MCSGIDLSDLFIVRSGTCNQNILSDLLSFCLEPQYNREALIKRNVLPYFLVNSVKVGVFGDGRDVCNCQSEKKYLCEQLRAKEKKFGRLVVPECYVAGI